MLKAGWFLSAALAMPLFSDPPKPPPPAKPERVINAREVLATGEVIELLNLRSDGRWYVLEEKESFTGKVIDKIFGRIHETSYARGLKHGPYLTIHRNGVISSMGVHQEGERVRHREWDLEGKQIELLEWNLDGTPRPKKK